MALVAQWSNENVFLADTGLATIVTLTCISMPNYIGRLPHCEIRLLICGSFLLLCIAHCMPILVWTPDSSGHARVWGKTFPGSVLLELKNSANFIFQIFNTIGTTPISKFLYSTVYLLSVGISNTD